MNDVITLIAAIVGSGALSSLITGLIMRPKIKADASKLTKNGIKSDRESIKVLQDIWHTEIQDLRNRVEKLEKERAAMETVVDELKKQKKEIEKERDVWKDRYEKQYEKTKDLEASLEKANATIAMLESRVNALEKVSTHPE